ncbi:thiamine diphosphokinase [Treponema phagedenis]|uniref:Thiamine diphosphokinase n=1 Tax=Treponema phagedenis TaxID=162 RepID=A0A0B7H2D4_TREPH|nr:thiamine diphosphokinase [Treponema phagedenis]EFW38098.1 thiamine diphosphokinase [Treponema phagedenis F0421]QEJ95508.1 thiamine diphosphokinase [Treponema phagedenis]QEJ97750.1 thiamine diphosphokinase [Treponema phagedenis]QSH95845.1 thiamine diphosphokinase [Treponema phagedenis]QSH99698.1 thiamine diphosphokinase [Treponema phagedenis]
MNAIIITGGSQPDYAIASKYFLPDSIIIAADSGLEAAASAGFTPDIILGDMDSLQNKALLHAYPEAQVQLHPCDKDFTDTELAVFAAKEKGAQDIIICGAGGGRADHFLSVARIFREKKPPRLWLYDAGLVYCVGEDCAVKTLRIDGAENAAISVFPAGEPCGFISSRGLHWELDTVNWQSGQVSLSNRSDGKPIELAVQSGRFLVFLSPLKEYRCGFNLM